MRSIVLFAVLALACGLPGAASAQAPRIVGGAPATIEQWPSTVALITDYGVHFCGGSIVQPQWVLTAGHCRVYPANAIRVISGTVALDGSGTASEVTRMLRHPEYRMAVPGAPRNDLMLLRLREPVTAPPIALATARPPDGTLLGVAGWGATSYNRADDTFGPSSNRLRATRVRLNTSATCVRDYGAGVFIPADMICASLPGRDACAGDSGGPLVEGSGPTARLVGVVSWGTGCALARYPGVYSLVTSHRCWIEGATLAPRPPAAVSAAAEDGALVLEWGWAPPCEGAPAPGGYRIRIAETGQVFDVAAGQRRAVVTGLVNGQPYTASVAALNINGESLAVTAPTAIPGPPPIAIAGAAWSGPGSASLRLAVAPTGESLRWRVVRTVGVDVRAGEWRELEAAAMPRALTDDVTGLPAKAVRLRVEVERAGTLATTRSAALEQPIRPAPVGGPRLLGIGEVGRSLICEIGRWTGTRPVTVSRSWLRDGRAIRGADAQSYRVGSADRGSALRCRVTVSGPGGAARATSPALRIAG